MLKEARGRARFEKSGAMRIYIPKDLVQSAIFPFKEEARKGKPFDLLVRIEPERVQIIIEKYSSVRK